MLKFQTPSLKYQIPMLKFQTPTPLTTYTNIDYDAGVGEPPHITMAGCWKPNYDVNIVEGSSVLFNELP